MPKAKLTPEKELEQLHIIHNQLKEQWEAVRNRISVLTDIVQAPALKKKYVGRYFTAVNTYGKPDRKWKIYYHVTGIREGQLVVNRFQTDCYGKCDFQTGDTVYQGVVETKITKRAYDTAFEQFIQKAKQLK